MLVLGFDNREYKFNYTKNRHRKGLSKLHKKAKKVIKSVFPDLPIYEEVTLPGSKRGASTSLLLADLFIPDLMLVVEAHGKQHFKYIPHFHGPKPHGPQKFARGRQRDHDKIEWCKMNNIDLLELLYNESEEEWKTALLAMRPRN